MQTLIFSQAVNPTKKVTPLMSPMRLGEKTGMGRALGMPKGICGWDTERSIARIDPEGRVCFGQKQVEKSHSFCLTD